jgi:hypothetical protein
MKIHKGQQEESGWITNQGSPQEQGQKTDVSNTRRRRGDVVGEAGGNKMLFKA